MIVCQDGGRIDVYAESMWPAGSCLEFWATVEVIGSNDQNLWMALGRVT
jgi:hypothetical protein